MKNNVYPCKPQFYCIKVGFKGSKLYRYVYVMVVVVRAIGKYGGGNADNPIEVIIRPPQAP